MDSRAIQPHTAVLNLHAYLHPSMDLPSEIMLDSRDLKFTIDATASVDDLMEACENMFFDAARNATEPLELVINVLWNTKRPEKALDPAEPLYLNFRNGDTFGVHGDLLPAESDVPNIPEQNKVPIMILTGFLGAGKTTLLNYILREQCQQKIAVIENEFGEVAIDDSLLNQNKLATAEKVVVMDNGCMCCTVRGDLEVGLLNMLDACKEKEGMDALIIETTGMADPVPIVRTIKQIPTVMSYFRLDAVITVADAKHLLGRLDDTVESGKVNEAYQQVAFADRVLLNKIDLVEAEQVVQVKERIRSINRLAKVITSVRGQIKLGDIMNLNAHSLMNFKDEDFMDVDDIPQPSFVRPKKGSLSLMSKSFGGLSAKTTRHSSNVSSFSIIREGEISNNLLCTFLGILQQPPPGKGLVLRFKAILAVKGLRQKMVMHAVQDVVEQDLLEEWAENEPRICKMVFIGKELDKEYFLSVFEKATSFQL